MEERVFKNTVIDRHFKVTFETIQGRDISKMLRQIQESLDAIIEKSIQGLTEADLGRVIIHHSSLNTPVIVGLRPLRNLTGKVITEYLAYVLTSHELLSMDTSFN